jgi:hypothetical protein
MKEQARAVIDSVKPLLEVCLKQADRFGNDHIEIATGRVREIIKKLKDLDALSKSNKPNAAMFAYLDNMAQERKMFHGNVY